MRIITDRHEELARWVCERNGSEYFGGGMCIGLEVDGQLWAATLFDDYNGASVRMHVAAQSKRWMLRAYLKACFDYPFNQLGCRVVFGLVESVNQAALRLDRWLGFKVACVIPGACERGDMVVHTMCRQDCRFLEA